jgi:predicted DNA-binding protein
MNASATKKPSKKAAASQVNEQERPIRLGRGAEGLRLAMGLSRALRGRPKAGAKAGGSKSRAVRLSDAEWEALDDLAAKTGLTSHGAMREAIVQWLARAGAAASAKRAAKRKAG